MIQRLSKEITDIDHSKCYDGASEHIRGVVKLAYKNIDFDIILLTVPAMGFTVLDTFDTDLCKIFMGKMGELVTDHNFDETYKTKKSRVNINISSSLLDYALKTHLPKLKMKYPEYDFIF